MKALRFILPSLVILAVVGLLVYEGLILRNLDSSNAVRGCLIIVGSVITMFKKPKQRPVANKKALYQKAYPEFIQEPFAEDPKLEKQFFQAVHDFNRNKPEAAIARLEKLRKSCQRTADLRAVTVFTALSMDDLGRYQESLALYDAARKIRDCSTLASNMGLCCHRLGRTEDAAKYYAEAIQLDSTNAFAHNNLSTLYFFQGDYESALNSARDALKYNAKMPQALSCAAICSKLLNQEEAYESYYRQAVAAGYDGDKIKQTIKAMNPKI